MCHYKPDWLTMTHSSGMSPCGEAFAELWETHLPAYSGKYQDNLTG